MTLEFEYMRELVILMLELVPAGNPISRVPTALLQG